MIRSTFSARHRKRVPKCPQMSRRRKSSQCQRMAMPSLEFFTLPNAGHYGIKVPRLVELEKLFVLFCAIAREIVAAPIVFPRFATRVRRNSQRGAYPCAPLTAGNLTDGLATG